jgi:hypothetical protein
MSLVERQTTHAHIAASQANQRTQDCEGQGTRCPQCPQDRYAKTDHARREILLRRASL